MSKPFIMKHALPTLLIPFLIAACTTKRDHSDDVPPLFSVPLTIPLNTEGGYSVNPVTGKTIEPLFDWKGVTLVTGHPIPARGRIIDPSTVEKPRVVPAGKPVIIPVASGRHVVPENLKVIPVDTSKLTKIRKGDGNPYHVLVNSTGDTIPTGVPVPARGKVVRANYPEPIQALSPRPKEAAIKNIQYLDVEQGMSVSHVISLLEDQMGNLWFATEGGGVCRYDGSSFIHFTEKEGLSNNVVLSILEDQNGNLWFGTAGGGVCRYDGESFTHFTEKDGLSNNIVWSIVEDTIGNIWVSTENGINQLVFDDSHSGPSNDQKTGESGSSQKLPEILVFSLLDGLKGQDFTPRSGLLDRYSRLWWGSPKGVTMLDPNRFRTSRRVPQPVLRQLDINEQHIDYRKLLSDKAVRASTGTGDLRATFSAVQRFENYPLNLELPYDQNHLIFHFSAIDWAAPHKIRYTYLKDGLDNNWSLPTPDDKASYRNIPHGSFIFKIRAIGESGRWSEPFEYPFSILPPWWLTWWAKTAYILFGIGFLGWIRQLELKKQKQKLAQERKINEQLRRVDQLKDQFLANTSHELRTPLNGIIGIAESLQDGVAARMSRKTVIDNLKMVTASGKRLASLVNDILDFFRLKNRDLTLQLQPLDLRSVTDVVLTLSRPLLKDKALRLINKIETSLPLVEADENRIQQILHNLIGNAIKFTDSGEVTVSAREVDGKVAVTISDTGIGIPEDQYETIFRSFEQADGTIAREYGGTGLGLSVTKQLVELHGGEISVISKVGQGSMFTFTLPVSQTKREAIPGPGFVSDTAEILHGMELEVDETSIPVAFPDVSGDPIEILIVDDEPVNRQVLENHLSLAGYRVTQATGGAEALKIMDSGKKFDLIILDIMMPKMSGYEVCHRLRDMYLPSELPVVMLTAKNRVTDLVEGFNSGANDYLTKPFSKDELLSRIKTHLNLHRINRATGKFVPYEFLRSVGRDSITEVQLGDHTQKEVTVFFSDIRDYTSLAEQMTPDQNFRFVNAYVGRMGPIIQKHGGFVNQYLGDAIMAIFPLHSDAALDAAIEMQSGVRKYNAGRQNKNRRSLDVGMGLHTGPLVMGIIGDSNRTEPATIADTVNTASRMEGLTKHYGARIVLTADSIATVQHPDKYHFRYLGKVQVKGKKDAVGAYECFGGDPEDIAELKLKHLDLFKEALDQFYARQFAQATICFDQIILANRQDLVARYFRRRAAQFVLQSPPDDWTGVERLDGK